MTGLIYIITNFSNGKVYIGKTRLSLEKRFKQHCDCAFNLKQNTRLYGAFRKYGKLNFSIRILKSFDDIAEKQLDIWESIFISKYCSMNPEKGYNMTAGGDGGGYLSQEVRKKISHSVRENHKKIKQKLSDIKKQQYRDDPDYLKRTADILAKAREKRAINLLLSKNGKRKK